VYDGGPAVDPQIELARAVLQSKPPLFGSCWGLQVVTVAAGGTVPKEL
jgi:GMP synthase (glutamine-hydrolysing)